MAELEFEDGGNMNNPYPETITDEVSGVVVNNPLHKAWKEGCEVGFKAGWDEGQESVYEAVYGG